MQYLFFVFIVIGLAVMLPLKFTLSFVATLLVITVVVKFTADAVIGDTAFKDAFKAAATAALFIVLATVMLLWAFHGSVTFQGMSALLALVGLFVAFVLGFKSALGSNFRSSAVVAVASTVVSGVLFYILKPYLF
jgi:hypothetical protein